MFYKYNEKTDEWYSGLEIHFPDGTKINSKNKISHDGWKWYDAQPFEDEIIETPNPFQS